VASARIPAELESTALIALDKLDKIGREGVEDELRERGIESASVAALFAALERLEQSGLEQVDLGEEGSAAARQLVEMLAAAQHGPAAKHLKLNPRLARGLSYYTGPIFEITLEGIAGSLGGGGRYDGLIGMFTKRQIPAVGFSLGLERILLVMEERGMFPPTLSIGPELLLCRFPDVPAAEAIRIATELRARGLRVEFFADTPALGKQIAYATTIGAPFVGIVGSEELARGVLAVKRLKDGEQKKLPLAQVASFVRA
jgi:histidyl-tRNA synthetase